MVDFNLDQLPLLDLDWIHSVTQAAPKAAADRPVHRTYRDYTNQWTDIPCQQCKVPIAGQIKFDKGPAGGRDKPTWFMRVRTDDGTLSKPVGKYFSRRITEVIGETDEGAKKWIEENKLCCGSKRTRPPWKLQFSLPEGAMGFKLSCQNWCFVEIQKMVLIYLALFSFALI